LRRSSRQNRGRLAAVTDLNRQSEPWVFVVDGAGKVTAKFEGIAAPAEMEAALRAL
jgi:hypothetical protein